MARISHSDRIPKYTVAVHKLGERAIGFVISGDDRIGDNLDHAELATFFESLCAAISRQYDGDPEGLKRAILALVGGSASPIARQAAATGARLDLSNFNGVPRTTTAADDCEEAIDPRALLRLKQVLKLIPVGASTWWERRQARQVTKAGQARAHDDRMACRRHTGITRLADRVIGRKCQP